MNKTVLKLFQIVITVGLIGLVLYQAGMFSDEGRKEFLSMLSGADMRFLVLSVLIGVLINMCSAFKWYMLTQSQGLGASYWRIFAYYVVGQFYNLFLPTSVGGDVVRSYELGKYSGRQADSLASVFVERYSGVLMLLLLSALAVLSQLSRFNVDFVIVSLVIFALGLGFIAWMLFDQRVYRALSNWAKSRSKLAQKVFAKLDKLLASVDSYRSRPMAIVWAFVNSFLFYIVAVLNVYVTALVFQLDVSLLDMCIATPIIMLIMNIPISFGNIGLMEFAYVNVLQLMGYSATLGLSIVILMRLKSLFDGALGGVLLPIFVTQKRE